MLTEIGKELLETLMALLAIMMVVSNLALACGLMILMFFKIFF